MKRTVSLLTAAMLAAGNAWALEPFDTHPNWGYAVTGLGPIGNETALVFTNPAVTATWTVPADLENVQFLVVGGGGGGGGDVNSGDGYQGGAGGGGGGVVTGFVHSVAQDAAVTVTVGAGGAGGKAGTSKRPTGTTSGNYYGAGAKGGDSLFKVGGTTYVTAYGGGQDLGASGKYSSGGRAGGSGGSSGGSRPKITDRGSATKGAIGSSATSLLTAALFGNKGGPGVKDWSYVAGGGGGAAEAGKAPPAQHSPGGDGGEGLTNSITGTPVVYGSGGGGGTAVSSGVGGLGGTGAGDGHRTGKGKGENAVANRGGGGGGGGGQANGGNGGSGIVVLRYAFDPTEAKVPTIASKEYTGETLTADVADTVAYTVDENDGGVDVGTYDVVLSIADGYHWNDDQLADTITLSFAITQAANVWTTEPSITKASWTHGQEDAGVLTNGVTRFGAVTATIAKDGGEAVVFDGTLPTAAGEYVITYTAPAATANYTAPDVTTKTVSFTIYAADAIPPYEMTIGTLSVGTDRTLSVPYSFSCDVTTAKTADLFARYTLDGDTTTNTAQIATGIALGGGNGTGTIADLKPGATYWVDVYATVDNVTSDPTALASVTVPGPASDLAASATFTPIPMEFILSGSVTPGLGTTTVTVEWSLNNAESFDNSATYTFAVGDDGAFSTNIPHAALSDVLTWRVTAANTVTTPTWGEQTFDGLAPVSETTVCRDWGRVTYTWTGLGGDNLWTNVLNWSGTNMTFDTPECYGYPGLRFSYYWDTVIFTNDAVVDLCGGTYGLRDLDDDSGEKANIRFSPNIKVTFRNGAIDLNDSPYLLGSNGTTITFDSCKTTRYVNESHFADFAAGSTTIFTGSITSLMRYRPTKENTKVIFRDGTISTLYSTDSQIKTTTTVDITNAVWHIERHPTETADTYNPRAGFGNVVTFRDGPDRQARLTTASYLYIDLRDTYDIVIPSAGLPEATIEAGYIRDDTNVGTFKVDVSQYAKKARIPLVKFTNTVASNQANNNTRVTTQLGNGSLTLQAIDRGKDVTQKRNAQLVWDNATQTIYYTQDYTAGTMLFLQ